MRFGPSLWLELKHKDGTLSGKRRVGIPKRDVLAFFGEGTVTPEMLRIQQRLYGEQVEQVLREVADLCGRYREPLRADCLVNYRRVPWQDEAGALRITLDLALAFFAPPEDLWRRETALVLETLGTPVGVERRCVLEIKTRGPHPPWLASVLVEAGAVREASKFEAASQAVHG